MRFRAFLCGVLFFPIAMAAVGHTEEHAHSDHDSHPHKVHGNHEAHAHGEVHVHGEAQLDIAVQFPNSVYILFESPAANIVGFEHAPLNVTERDLLRQASKVLAEPDNLFRFAGATCRQRAVDVKPPHANAGLQATKHSSFSASYEFACEDLQKLESVTVHLFSSFPDVHKIGVQWMAPTGQGAASLTERSRAFNLH